MKLVTSPYPNVPLFRRSIFTHLLGTTPDTPHLIGGFPASSPAFIDAATATVLSRATLRSYALQFAFSLHDLPAPLAYTPNPTTPATVLIFSPNTIVWPILLHGVAAAGFRTTLANSAFTSSELAYQYANANASLIFTYPSLLSVVLDALKSLGCTESEIRSTDAAHLVRLDAFFGRGELQGEVSFDGERSNETLYLCYSSGTTGKPKGVETTHYNLVSLIEILRPSWPTMIPCLTPFLPAGHPGTAPGRVFWVVAVFPYLWCDQIVDVPTLPGHTSGAIEKYNMTSIHTLYSGAAPLGADLVATIRTRLQKVGADVIVSQAYGLTETSPTMIVLHPKDANTHIGSVGHVLPNLEVQLVREDAGEIITDIEGAGEIWVRGPTVMKGYLNNPSATASAITPDGWFKTGDIAISDAEGFITIIDRRKELIKYKGFQVAPAELEALLLQHPDVTDAAVVGVDSKEEATELPRAYIVPTGPITPRESAVLALEVQAWVADRVAAHKKLRGGVITVDGIPKSASGKILRRELRERAKGEVGHGQVGPRVKL
ncbi:AMP binding protein [Boletus reticuloceps]|uniref:AMP binding protein n=1 Tax=Boletus reticuloceps TaxID=495285 RepID=A0A8I3ADV3_9AGAM|nr:AMP binding protein [Boletus reticuloceps]